MFLAETWDAGSQSLQGTSRVEADDPYELRIVVPVAKASWRVRDVTVDDEDVQIDWRQQGPGIRVTLSKPEAVELHWTVTFDKDSVSQPEGPQDITLLKAEGDANEVRLSWKPCRADVYRLTRQDGRVVEVEEAGWVDRDVKPDTLYVYQVQAVVWDSGLQGNRGCPCVLRSCRGNNRRMEGAELQKDRVMVIGYLSTRIIDKMKAGDTGCHRLSAFSLPLALRFG